LQKHYANIQSLGAEMYGISVDPPEKSKAVFVNGRGIKFPLLSDKDKQTINAYGVFNPLTGISKPATFILDKSGVVQWKAVGINKADRVKGATIVEQLTTLNPPNRPPVISSVIPDFSIEADVPHTVDLSKYATDEEDTSDNLSWRIDAEDNGIFRVQVDGHKLTIELIQGMSGTANFTLTLVDSEGEEASQVVRVTVNKPIFDLDVPAGVSLFHIPLAVTDVDDAPRTIMRLSDLFDVLGGQANVHWLLTTPPPTSDRSNRFQAFFMHTKDDNFPANVTIGPGTGLIASLKRPVQVKFAGEPIAGALQLHPGLNLIGIPRYSVGIRRLSDFTKRAEIRSNVTQIAVHINGRFQTFAPGALVPGSANDIPLAEGQAFIVTAKTDAVIRF
jgi:ribosomal protein S16